MEAGGEDREPDQRADQGREEASPLVQKTQPFPGRDAGKAAQVIDRLHAGSPIARRRPDRRSSRSSGVRKGTSLGTTGGVIARSRATIARASSSRPIWA